MDLKCLAIIWALKHFRDLIYGYEITVYTNHKAIKDLFKGRNLTGRLARWMVILEDYRPKIEYVPGKLDHVVDALSRAVVAPLINDAQNAFSDEELMHAQCDDSLLGKIIGALESNTLPSLPDLPVSPSKLHLHDGLLIRGLPADNTYNKVVTQLVITRSLVPRILSLSHDSVHAARPGIDRTLRSVLQLY